MTEPASVARAAAGMGVATAVSRGIGFVRILVIAAVLGTTFLGNTYQSSNAVGNILFELLAAGALSAVLVPTFVEHLDRGDVAGAERLAGRILGVALIALGAVALIGILAAPWIAKLLTAGVTDPAVAEAQQSLSTFLLRFVVPQVLLYAVGAVSVAVLYAKRRLAVTAMAPIGLTVVVVTAMGVFRAVAGPDPGLDLALGEKLILALGATLGVAAFVGIPTIALRRSGFRLVPRLGVRDPAIGRVLRLSAWAVFQHSMIGLLLLGAIVVGNTVEGGTLAYQVAWVFFLAPYAVLAQPIHTAILPDLARQATDPDHFASSVHWALDGMAVLVVPVAAFLVALAVPIMRVAAFGQATRAGGVGLLAAGLASLAVGLYTYSAFLLFARAYYALGNSRTPALTALASAGVGITVMAVGGAVTSGRATVAVLGFGHTAAYAFGAIVLWVGLTRRTGHLIVPRSLLRSALVAAPLATCAWLLFRVLEPAGRMATLGALVATTLVAGSIYVVVLRALGGVPSLHPALPWPVNPESTRPHPTGPEVPGVEPFA
ncbi:MAG: lipid II flippase MurJ [Acidimicrobiia bacterium]